MKTGDSVDTTCFGAGILQHYREVDCVYVVELPFGMLYCNKKTLNNNVDHNNKNQKNVDNEKQKDQEEKRMMMELNAAYEALERMRKLNLEVTCQEAGIACVNFDQCKTCLLSQPPVKHKKNNRLARAVARGAAAVQQQRQKMMMQSPPPCLVCATPVCRKHASASFRKQAGIVMCGDCELLFGMDYVVTVLTCPTAKQRRQHVDRMIELYDRAVLLLKTSAQYIDNVAQQLEQSTKRQNRVGLGSSSAGIVSGVLGIVSAATLLTPAGPPLLVASLLFGGGATAAQTGSEVQQYYSAPNQLADKIIALHGLVLNILRLTGTLRDALLRDYLRKDMYQPVGGSNAKDDNDDNHEKMLLKLVNQQDPRRQALQKNQTGLLASAATLGSVTLSSASLVEAGQGVVAAEALATNARFVSRGGTAAMRSMRFARFAGGTLAAATLVLEAKSLKQTLHAMQAGNPCAKAETLRRIAVEMTALPATQALDAECDHYLQALTHRLRVMSQDEVARLLQEHHEELLEERAEREQQAALKQQAQRLAALHEKDITAAASLNELSLNEMDTSSSSSKRRRSSATTTKATTTTTSRQQRRFVRSSSTESFSSAKSTSSSMSLLERIEIHKLREQSSSLSSSQNNVETTAAETKIGIQLTS